MQEGWCGSVGCLCAGQDAEHELDEDMYDLYNGRIDVLVSQTIQYEIRGLEYFKCKYVDHS